MKRVTFDPRKLTQALKRKLQKTINSKPTMRTRTCCRIWLGRSLKNGKYPTMRLGQDICKRLGIKDRAFTVGSIVASLKMNKPLYKDAKSYRTSHLCHDTRCIAPDHLTLENMKTNITRQGCNKAGRCSSKRHVGMKCLRRTRGH